ncbi:probable transcriptional regulator SLK2 [Amborella trichopoda]|nr:probable transcriptional regulator SLK2 [Amborella trichopoda]XP_020531427.1 probable transcriptional regulator SLK2 [Amborella trichopoda]XP_020531428.1 probable transcriptional regulator SLK2 [Amborella trichopoda]|eukprot:XP_011628358.1 probable transcriptional regulator SLK2 [Amborella trichopoda]
MNRVLNSAANSGPSVGASSLVTDANSALSGGPHLQRSASINTESYMRLPASPMSFSSGNNISISGSSVMDGSSIAQQSGSSVTRIETHHDQNSQQIQQRQQHGASPATSQQSQVGSGGQQPLGPLGHEARALLLQQKPRLDIRTEDILQQQVIQQMLRQENAQLQGQNPQLQALLQQQKLFRQQQQQQQLLQSLPQFQRTHMQHQQQQQLRQHLQQQGVQAGPMVKRFQYESGMCARRLMQYVYHQRQRPEDNDIKYWRKFVAEYFAPRAKKRWCLSKYENVGHHALGVFPRAAMDVWQCDICGSKSGRGFETTVEVLPRLNKIKFDSGVEDELLFVDMPQECRLPSGLIVLDYGKAIQESVYENLRVVREGQLRIIFTPELKILSWEFCARRHEELLPRKLVAPQVNQLVQVAQKYQTAVAETGSSGSTISTQDLQTNCNMFVQSGRQLARVLELQSLNDLGFSKRYIRCLQISEVVNSMKDLIDFSTENKMGPIASLKNFPRPVATPKLQIPKVEMEQMVNSQNLASDQNSVKLMAMHSGLANHANNHIGAGAPSINSSNQTAAVALSNYQNMLRQNSMSSNQSPLQQDGISVPCSFGNPNPSPTPPACNNPAQTSPFQCQQVSSMQGSLQNPSLIGLSSPLQSPNLLQQTHSHNSQGNHHFQQQMIHQLLQDMMNNNNGGAPQQSQNNNQTVNGNGGEDMFNGMNNGVGGRASSGMMGNGMAMGNNGPNMSNNIIGMMPNRSNSFKGIANSSSQASGNNAFNLRSSMQHMQEMVPDIPHDFTENGILNGEPGDIGFGWKN